MNDLYLIENSTVLKNLLGITDEKELDLAEAELSRANMMLLYEKGFDDFSSGGFCFIHKFLFGDVVYFDTEKCIKLNDWIKERLTEPIDDKYRQALEVLKSYCEHAIELKTGIMVEL